MLPLYGQILFRYPLILHTRVHPFHYLPSSPCPPPHQVAAIVRQFAAANQADRATGAAGGWAPWSRRSRPIVILSELPKAVMDDQVLEVLRWVTPGCVWGVCGV